MPALPADVIPMRQSDVMAAAAPDSGNCQNLSEVWPPGFYEVSGRRYWLDRAFTLDEDNNGAVDNIGFILKAEDRPELFIYFFPGGGRQSVVTVPTLRLTDDRDVVKICFGQEEFEKPREKPKTKPDAFKAPDLAAELAAKLDKPKAGYEDVSGPGGAGGTAPKKAFWDGPGLIFIIIAGAGILLILRGGVGYAVAKRRSDRRREERRRLKKRRGEDRRKRQQPPDEDDRRTSEDQRKEAERRKDDDRRKEEEDRRQ